MAWTTWLDGMIMAEMADRIPRNKNTMKYIARIEDRRGAEQNRSQKQQFLWNGLTLPRENKSVP